MKILVVDDIEEAEVMAELLRVTHEVYVAKNGGEAVRVYAQHGPFDLVLSDLYHPDMTFDELRRQLPETQHIVLVTAFPILRKPFMKDDLLEFVEAMRPITPKS